MNYDAMIRRGKRTENAGIQRIMDSTSTNVFKKPAMAWFSSHMKLIDGTPSVHRSEVSLWKLFVDLGEIAIGLRVLRAELVDLSAVLGTLQDFTYVLGEKDVWKQSKKAGLGDR